MIELNPSNEICFVKKDISSIPEAFLEVKNTSDSSVIFKIKTTNPDKYVVKPNHAILKPESICRVMITTQKASMQKIKNDRFLVVASLVTQEEEDNLEGQSDIESFVKNFFTDISKEKQFMKKLKIRNDETLGLSYASFKAFKTNLETVGTGVVGDGGTNRTTVARRTIKNDISELEEEYNSLASKIAELGNKKTEINKQFNLDEAGNATSLSSNIRLKKSNRELMQKARLAAGGEGAAVKSAGKFELIHIAGAFLIAFLIGMWYGM